MDLLVSELDVIHDAGVDGPGAATVFVDTCSDVRLRCCGIGRMTGGVACGRRHRGRLHWDESRASTPPGRVPAPRRGRHSRRRALEDSDRSARNRIETHVASWRTQLVPRDATDSDWVANKLILAVVVDITEICPYYAVRRLEKSRRGLLEFEQFEIESFAEIAMCAPDCPPVRERSQVDGGSTHRLPPSTASVFPQCGELPSGPGPRRNPSHPVSCADGAS